MSPRVAPPLAVVQTADALNQQQLDRLDPNAGTIAKT